jgi:hypothetical protein
VAARELGRQRLEVNVPLRTVSWVILTVVATLTLLGGLASAGVAYFSQAGVAMSGTVDWNPEVATAIRARRATAAGYAAGYATVLLFLALGPYRRGERWSWWAVLAGSLVLGGIVLARGVLLGTTAGLTLARIQLGASLVALVLDAGRLRGPRVSP